MVDQNEVVAGIAVLLDDLFVQAVEQLLIREPAVAQGQQIGAALVGRLVPVELQLKQIAAERAGNGLFRNFKVLEILVLLQLGEHIGKFEHDLLAAVDVAAAHAVKRALFLFQPAAQLLHIALGNIHKSSLSLLYIEHRLPEKRPFPGSLLYSILFSPVQTQAKISPVPFPVIFFCGSAFSVVLTLKSASVMCYTYSI